MYDESGGRTDDDDDGDGGSHDAELTLGATYLSPSGFEAVPTAVTMLNEVVVAFKGYGAKVLPLAVFAAFKLKG